MGKAAMSFSNSSAAKRSLRETKRPDQYSDGCAVLTFRGSGGSWFVIVLEPLDRRERDVKEGRGSRRREELELKILIDMDDDEDT